MSPRSAVPRRHVLLLVAAVAVVAFAADSARAQPAPHPPGVATERPAQPAPGARRGPLPGERGRMMPRPPAGAPGAGPHRPVPGQAPSPHGAADAHGAEGAAHGTGHGAAAAGHGPKDRPAGINLTHGWLGINNEKAVPAPADAKPGSAAWWVWRLTPYPWRYSNEADKHDLRNEPVPLLAPIVNFAILAYLLWRFGRKPLQEGLRKRAAGITAEIDAATAIKKKASERLRGYQDELDHLDDTLALLREKYAAEAEAEKKDIVTEAGHARDRMLADANFRVAQDAKTARDQLSRKALEDALVAAEQLLGDRVTAQDVDRIADEYLEFVGPALRAQVGSSQGAAS